MKLSKLSVLFLLYAIVAGSPCLSQPVTTIEVVGDFKPIPIAIVPFDVEMGIAPEIHEQFHEILQYDLEFSGYFHILPNMGQIKEVDRTDRESGQVNDTAWREIGADAVVKGVLRKRSSSEIEVELRVFYTKGASRVAGKRYWGDQKHFRQLVHKASDEIVFRLTGNPGIAQTRIAFIYEVLKDGTPIKELYVMDYDGAKESMTQITFDKSLVMMPAWSPDGKHIAFTSYVLKNPDLYSVELATGKRRNLSMFPGLNNCPAYSPDGRKLALVLSKDGNSEIYELDLISGKFTRLTFSRGKDIDCSPSYSPDGKKLVFTSDRTHSLKLYQMDTNGYNVQLMTPEEGWYDLAVWSPRGNRIAFVGSNDRSRNFDIFVADKDGLNRVRLTGGAGSNENPSWSPDGRHLVFKSNRKGNWSLYTMDMNGQNVRQITFLPGNCHSPAWSPNQGD